MEPVAGQLVVVVVAAGHCLLLQQHLLFLFHSASFHVVDRAAEVLSVLEPHKDI